MRLVGLALVDKVHQQLQTLLIRQLSVGIFAEQIWVHALVEFLQLQLQISEPVDLALHARVMARISDKLFSYWLIHRRGVRAKQVE